MEVDRPATSGCQLAPEVSSSNTNCPAEKIDPSATVIEYEPLLPSAERSCMNAASYGVNPLQCPSPSEFPNRPPGPMATIGVVSTACSMSFERVVMVFKGFFRIVIPAPAPRKTTPLLMLT